MKYYKLLRFHFLEKYLYDACLILADNLNKVAWTNQLSIIRSMNFIFDKYYNSLNVKVENKS